LTGNTSKADSEYVKDALTIEDEYESELAAVQVELTRFEVAPHEYAARRAEIAARAYLRLTEAHQRFLGRNNLPGGRGPPAPRTPATEPESRHAGSGVYGNLRFSLEQAIESDSWTP
jgi:hypothetical protein